MYSRVGVKGAVLTAKHGCGHLLWPTNVSLPDGRPYSYAVGERLGKRMKKRPELEAKLSLLLRPAPGPLSQSPPPPSHSPAL